AGHAQQAAAWDRQAVAAVEAHDDDRARRALARKLECLRLAESLDLQLAEAATTNASLRRQVDALRTRYAQSRRKLATLVARQSAADAQRRMHTSAAALDFGRG